MKNKVRKIQKFKSSFIGIKVAITVGLLLTSLLKTYSQEITIKGTIDSPEFDSIYLAHPFSELFLTAPITEKSFEFKFNLSEKSVVNLGFNQDNMMEVFVSPGDNVELTLGQIVNNNPEIKGSPETKFIFDLIAELYDVSSKRYEYHNLIEDIDYSYLYRDEDEELLSTEEYELYDLDPKLSYEELREILVQKRNEYENKVKQMIEDAVLSHLDYLSSIYLVEALSIDEYIDVHRKLDASLISKYPDNQLVLKYHEGFINKSKLAIGSVAPEIIQADINGKNIPLSELKGKYVLIDFWATWCGPCHREIPNLKQAYNLYNSKGFEIYSVSLDENREKWLKTIEDKELSWVHVGDMLGWRNEAALAYNVEAIPFTILLDKEGKIIAKNLRGQDLEDKLKELLD